MRPDSLTGGAEIDTARLNASNNTILVASNFVNSEEKILQI